MLNYGNEVLRTTTQQNNNSNYCREVQQYLLRRETIYAVPCPYCTCCGTLFCSVPETVLAHTTAAAAAAAAVRDVLRIWEPRVPGCFFLQFILNRTTITGDHS